MCFTGEKERKQKRWRKKVDVEKKTEIGRHEGKVRETDGEDGGKQNTVKTGYADGLS